MSRSRMLMIVLIAAAVCMASAGVGAAAATGYAEEEGSIQATDDEGATNSTSAVITVSGVSNVIYVPDDYTTIQAAVDAASAGDTIYVLHGSYTVNVNKQLTLQGEGANVVTVTAASTSDHVFEVTANWVNINGFTVRGATSRPKAGIYLGSGVGHCNISNNIASNNYYGIYYSIYLDSSSNNTLTSNTASNNNRHGIDLWYSSSNNIYNNNVSNNGDGISLGSSSSNSITNNVMNSDGTCVFG